MKLGRKKYTLVDCYLAEPVNYGGLFVSRAEMIRDLLDKADGDQRLVDRYLQGHKLAARKLRERLQHERESP